MNQLCKVCGEPAAGYHFGAFTCEGCKSFFGRTYNNLTALGECKNNNTCVINKKNRTSCKSCRLKKCLVVGMSKSGSRYGRRSNWFKIHCLIQDQQEMTNRLAEQGVLQSNGQIQRAFNENKDLLSQYKTTTDSFRETNSASSAHHVSPRAASPNSSEGSVGALSSPFSSLFDSTKGNGFANRFDTNSPSYVDSRKEMNHHFGIHTSGLPLSPVSPLSPINPVTTARFLFHNSMVKGLNGLQAFPGMSKLYNADLGFAAYPSRLLSLHSLNPVLKQSSKDPDLNQNIGECYADVPEQERPIDLSVKSTNPLSEAALRKLSKSLKTCVGDRDSGFSPSSNEENNNNNNNNSSPLDLTAKRTPDPPIDEPNEEHSDSDEDEHNSQLESSEDK